MKRERQIQYQPQTPHPCPSPHTQPVSSLSLVIHKHQNESPLEKTVNLDDAPSANIGCFFFFFCSLNGESR